MYCVEKAQIFLKKWRFGSGMANPNPKQIWSTQLLHSLGMPTIGHATKACGDAVFISSPNIVMFYFTNFAASNSPTIF